MPTFPFSALPLSQPPFQSISSSISLVTAAVMCFRDTTNQVFTSSSYSRAEGSCDAFDSTSYTCLNKKLVLVSNPVFFASLWHSHTLNASQHTKLLKLKTISEFSATVYWFDSLLSKFHLATQNTGSMCLCFTAVNPQPFIPCSWSGSSSQNTKSHSSFSLLSLSCPFIWHHLQLCKDTFPFSVCQCLQVLTALSVLI